jgi:hypothetical protein
MPCDLRRISELFLCQVYSLCGIEERDFLQGPGEMFKKFAGVQIVPAVSSHHGSASSDDQLATKALPPAPDQRDAESLHAGACDTLRVHAGSGATHGSITRSGYAVLIDATP